MPSTELVVVARVALNHNVSHPELLAVWSANY